MLGDSWVNLGRPHANSDGVLFFKSLGNGIVLAGSSCPVGNAGHWFKSINWGLSWTDKGAMPSNTSEESVYILVDCSGGVVMAGMGPGVGQVSRSTDYGDSFTWIKTLRFFQESTLSGAYLGTFGGDNIVVMATNTSWTTAPRIFRSLDKGLTWDDGHPAGGAITGISVLLNLGSGVALYGSGRAEVGRTTDYGVSWIPVHSFGGAPEGVENMLSISGVVYAVLRNAEVWKSSDQGSNWTKQGETGTTTVVGFAYVPELDLMFAGVGGIGFEGRIYRSQDKGRTWSDLGIISQDGGILTIEYIVGSSEYILLAGDGGVVTDDVAHIYRATEAFPEGGPPDTLFCEQTKNPINVSDPQPEFSAIYRYE